MTFSFFFTPPQEQDKSSDIEQQLPFGDRKYSITQPQNKEGVQNQREHHIILTKYEATDGCFGK